MDVVVPVYSIAKSYTAVAALRFLDIDAEVGHYVSDLPDSLQPLTLRSLLNHTPGLSDYGAWADYHEAVRNRESAWPVERVLARASIGHPGGFQYSNIGYLLVRLALERSRGADFFTVLEDAVFTPLGMRAFPFAAREDWAHCLHPAIDANLRAYDPAWVYTGTFAANPGEAARGLAAVIRGELGEPIPRLMMEANPVGAPAEHPMSPDAGYGLGLMTKGRPIVAVGHGGGGPGFALFAAVNPAGTRWSAAVEAAETENLGMIAACINEVLDPARMDSSAGGV